METAAHASWERHNAEEKEQGGCQQKAQPYTLHTCFYDFNLHSAPCHVHVLTPLQATCSVSPWPPVPPHHSGTVLLSQGAHKACKPKTPASSHALSAEPAPLGYHSSAALITGLAELEVLLSPTLSWVNKQEKTLRQPTLGDPRHPTRQWRCHPGSAHRRAS